MTDFLKTLVLVNAAIAVAFAIFYQLVMSCVSFQISAWWASPFFFALYLAFIWQPAKSFFNTQRSK